MTTNPEHFLRYAKLIARKLERENRSVGAFTGIIGELAACQAMRAKWQPSEGYDAITRQGRRVSIKTRVKRKDRDPSPTMGTFRRNKQKRHEFDVGWYVELNPRFELKGIWEAKKRIVAKLQDARKGKGISVAKFKNNSFSRQIWPSEGRKTCAIN